MKKLHWMDRYGMGDSYSYTITDSGERFRVWIQEAGDDEGSDLGEFDTLEEAKTFADEDYRRTMYG